MTKEITSIEQLERFTDAMVEDILNLTDEEILLEAKEQFNNPMEEIQRTRSVTQDALLKASKARLVESRNQVALHKQENTKTNVIQISSIQKRSVIEKFTNQDHDLKQKLTLAARKGEGIQTENDIDGMLEDMLDLNIIDTEGNTK